MFKTPKDGRNNLVIVAASTFNNLKKELETLKGVTHELCLTIELWKEKCISWEKKLNEVETWKACQASRTGTNEPQTSQL